MNLNLVKNTNCRNTRSEARKSRQTGLSSWKRFGEGRMISLQGAPRRSDFRNEVKPSYASQAKEILAFVVFQLMACAFNPALAMDGREIVPSGIAGRHGSRGRHGRMGSSYGGNTRDAIGYGDMMGGSSGISGMNERYDMGTNQQAASLSSSRQDIPSPPPMDLATFTDILVEMRKLCYASLQYAGIAEDVRNHLQHLNTLCEAIIAQTTESGIQQDIAVIFEVLHPVMLRVDASQTIWGVRLKIELKDLMSRLEGRERVLRADLEVARKYSIVVRLINKMFRSIDAEISRMDTDQSHVKLALKLMRRGWFANGDIIHGIEEVLWRLEFLVKDCSRRYFGDVIEGILWGTFKWLEQSREGDHPWENPEPGARPQLLKTDPVVAGKYSNVLRRLNRVLRAIDEEISARGTDCGPTADLRSLRDAWEADGDIIEGIETVWAGLDRLINEIRSDGQPRYPFGSYTFGILLRTYRWLEQNSVGENPWQDPIPS
ncbi:hypothetical protein SeLEV6574_g06638 [Synchytrium endobioticum]|uniref:Uncharacterized protein n=1 Tax=Synchytrium endobioticum TaxID=286115 RepID=A0A507CMG3_9FUNG|nr:hypothetical protein SeLEV6574_g06638 [Synchytrium endobioticum]